MPKKEPFHLNDQCIEILYEVKMKLTFVKEALLCHDISKYPIDDADYISGLHLILEENINNLEELGKHIHSLYTLKS